tara:strand:- start:6277 stop:6438 length:162 start_codon:yes stop_codon:yes gene_type:complete
MKIKKEALGVESPLLLFISFIISIMIWTYVKKTEQMIDKNTYDTEQGFHVEIE